MKIAAGLNKWSWAIGALVALGGCRAPRQRPPDPPVADEAVALQREGLERLWRGDQEGAAERFRAALEHAPLYVAAHRELQILGVQEHRREELLARYEALFALDPTDGRRAYLVARLWTDPDRQEAAFRAAISRYPDEPWLHFGLGQLALARNRLGEAESWFRRGLEQDPAHRELRLGLARCLLTAAQIERAASLVQDLDRRFPRDPEVYDLMALVHRVQDGDTSAFRWMGRLLAREPWMGAVALRAHAMLRDHGSLEEARWLLLLLRPRLADPEAAPEFRDLLFRAALQAGEWSLAAELGGERAEAASWQRLAEWRRALFHVGRYRDGLETVRRSAVALAGLGQDVSAFDEACAKATALEQDREDGDTRARLARLLQGLGLTEEALLVLGEADGSPLRHDLEGQLAFESELDGLAREAYREFEDDGRSPGLDEFLGEVREAAQRDVGRDLLAEEVRLEIPLVGALLDPDPEHGDGLGRYFAERGRLAVIGRRTGHPPEVFLAPRLAAGRVPGRDTYLAWVEGERIPSFLQTNGANLSGAALVRFVYLDVARILEETDPWRDQVEGPPRSEVPPPPAPNVRARRSLGEPGDLVFRLMRRAWEDYRRRRPDGDWDGFRSESVQEVLTHETTHLEDEDRLLTFGPHWLSLVPRFLRRGLDADRLQAWAEMRAQCGALRGARNPYLALANLVGFLPARTIAEGGPHAAAYHELLTRFVTVLDEAPERFPGLDHRANLLLQLDRLSVPEIREAADEVSRGLGLGDGGRSR